MTEWKLFAKSSLRHKILLQNTRQRKQRRYLRACFVRFITHAQESVLSRKLLTRMYVILSKRFLSSRLTRWKAVVYRYKIEDALCLGHDAMRKTKVDMAKRLYSRARRARLNGAMLKWKTETQNDRTMEEHANAVEAMSNWAARIAGGRILKERFQTWIAYTYKMLWEKSERRVSLKYNLMRLMKMKISFGFRKWKYYSDFIAKTETQSSSVSKIETLEKSFLLKIQRSKSNLLSRLLANSLLRVVRTNTNLAFSRWKNYVNIKRFHDMHQEAKQKRQQLQKQLGHNFDRVNNKHRVSSIRSLFIHLVKTRMFKGFLRWKNNINYFMRNDISSLSISANRKVSLKNILLRLVKLV